MTPRLYPLILALLALSFLACDEPSAKPKNTDDADLADLQETDLDPPDISQPRPSVRFDLHASANGDFFAFPFPNALRTAENGALDLSTFPNLGSAKLQALIDTSVANQVPGLSPNGAIYFAFEEALDPASLPATPADTIEPDASVFLINLDPSSSRYGWRIPVETSFNPDGNAFLPPNTLRIHSPAGLPLRPATRYAAIITDQVRLSTDQQIGPNPTWEAIRNHLLPPDGVSPELHAHVRELLNELQQVGLNPASVIVATTFTVADLKPSLTTLQNTADALPFAVPTNMQYGTPVGPRITYHARFPYRNFLAAPPLSRQLGTNLLTYDDQQRPVPRDTTDATVYFSIPADLEYPILQNVFFFPGLHQDATHHTEAFDSLVNLAIQESIPLLPAVISTDPLLTQDMAPAGTSLPTLWAELLIHNPIGARDLLRAAVLHDLQVLRMAEVLTVEVADSHVGAALSLRTTPLVLVGTDFAAQSLALTAIAQPRVDAVVLQRLGASFAHQALNAVMDDVDLRATFTASYDIPAAEPLDPYHPLMALIYQPILDPVDPVNFAQLVIKEPELTPVSVLMTLATDDLYANPYGAAAFAAAAAIPPLQPNVYSPLPWLVRDIAPANLPLQGNVSSPATTCLGPTPCRVTAAALTATHASDFNTQEPLLRHLAFFTATACLGTPTLPLPEP